MIAMGVTYSLEQKTKPGTVLSSGIKTPESAVLEYEGRGRQKFRL